MLRPTCGLGLIDKIAKGILYITGFLVVAYALLRWVLMPAFGWFMRFVLWLSEDAARMIMASIEATAPWSVWLFVSAFLAGMWLFYRSIFRFIADLRNDKE